ncbi:hypothetical protein Taro_050609 [Colocasia esculenta]|uniref:Uncharacterized protein n=1 Tax=Colocasia esculenta TaxID=4460 RepID=A0A843XEG9_COLES|nr:hypothetical protein [Colocasia esculenta]
MRVLQVAVVAVPRAWRVWSLGVFIVLSDGLCSLVMGVVHSGEGSSQDRPLSLLAEFAWALLVKVLCPWPCVWLPRWPACLVSHFQVSRPRWRDLCVPVA